MSYFGDSYRSVGDPGFFGSLAKIGGKVLKVGTAIAGLTPQGRVVSKVAAVATGVALATKLGGAVTPFGGPIVPVPGIKGTLQRFLPGGATGYEVRRSRRMQFTNQKALNRAIRRVTGFGNLVKRSKKSIAKANRTLNPGRPAAKAKGKR